MKLDGIKTFVYLDCLFPTDAFLCSPLSSIANIRHSKASKYVLIFLLPMSLDSVGTIQIYGTKGEKRRGRWEMWVSRGGGGSLAEEQKAKLMITRDLEMGMRRTEASSPHSFNLHSFPDLPPLHFFFLLKSLAYFLSSLSLALSAPYYGKCLLSFMCSSRLEMIRPIKPHWGREEKRGGRWRRRSEGDWFLYLEERRLKIWMNIIGNDGHQKLPKVLL